ncbi:MAG TPA: hypothetical protein VJZ51_00870 [Bacilli bacterium]|nr:hypothetical protein [Bacilli bacterium]
MKKISAVLSLFIVLAFAGCKVALETTPLKIDIDQIALSEEEEGFIVTLIPGMSSFEGKQIIRFGALYGLEATKNKLTKENALSQWEVTFHEEEKYIFLFSSIDKANYNKSMIIRPYIVYSDGEVAYATNSQTILMYNLAKLDSSAFSKEIVARVEGKAIAKVSIAVNTKTYQASTKEDGYTVDITTDYNHIFVTVTLKDNYIFLKEISLIVNGETIASEKWTKDEKIITYTFDDPNWTAPY